MLKLFCLLFFNSLKSDDFLLSFKKIFYGHSMLIIIILLMVNYLKINKFIIIKFKYIYFNNI